MMFRNFFLFAFLLSTTSHVSAIDFCIADLKVARTPAGYPCKSPATVTVDDFVFSNYLPGKNNIFNFSFTLAYVDIFPSLNGLGFSMARFDIEEGGVVPMHTHADADEVIIMLQGNLTAGFISSDSNTAFVKTISEGNIIVLPKGLLHFALNVGKGKASANVIYSSVKPSVQLFDVALFGNNLDSAIVEKTTFLDHAQVQKLKGQFKGSG
ncbi:hypothetical protein TanjilG_23053 [Lupinus angustifolius]|uniref:Germin-like protein n=1 Tax=Lupinus angustifolius TaxID=3871 RepID=A0A1J7FN70_LUPAN|nr:PREDICTED: germin-like protein subfamily 3 member 1 [Lupinus angustifolius]OIV89351.1 hypothetical protein TanjilG_23053 [Lupinus angustifolius]